MKHLTHCVLLTKTNNKRRIKISSKPHVLAEKLKMRLFFALMGNGRWPQKIDKVPFRALLPLKLRNRVSGKSDRQKLAPCIQELTALFAKMKEHEFDEQLCAKEIETLRKANRDYLTSRYVTKQTRSEGVVTPGKDLHYKQLNNYLKLYPDPSDNKK